MSVERSPWMTSQEAAEYLRFPGKRIYNLTRSGDIPCRKQEGRLLFCRDELDAWLDTFYCGPPRLDLRSRGD
jgi:excisionase family DNA binding protein